MNYVNSLNNYIVFVVLFLFNFSFSQEKAIRYTDLKVVYEFSYKKFVNSSNHNTTNTILINKEKNTLFSFEKMFQLSEIQQLEAIEPTEALLYRTPYFFLIKRKNQEIEHHESIGSDLLKFKETVSLDWKLVNEEKEINTLSCKKATLNFLGRKWIAWYATKIPINTGPYKFFGLPGLIISIKDSENIFQFKATEIQKGNFNVNQNIKNYFVSEKNEKFYDLKKEEFYKIRTKFYEMTLNERLKYMNRNKDEVVLSVDIKSSSGEKVRTNRKTKARNFIEQEKK